MKTQDLTKTTKWKFGIGLISLAVLLAVGLSAANAQTPSAHQHPATNAPLDAAAFQMQIGQLRSQVAELGRIIQSHGGTGPQMPAAGMSGMPGMPGGGSAGGMGRMGMDNMMIGMDGMKGGGMQGMSGSGGGMGMMDMDMMKMMRMGGGSGGNMPGMSPSSGGGMGMMGMMKDMDMMGMGGMQSMNMPSALPGFPGGSHLYHIGATGFFLDHPQHITLTTEQQTALNKTKEQAALAKNKTDREIEQAEQELWELTAADQPDAGKIETKIREIEKLRGNQRLGFIRSVGDAARVLTEEQRKQLVGLAAPARAGTSTPPHTSHTP